MIKISYIIFDLEFNQSSEDKEHRVLNFEIIQIGAIKMDEHFNIIDKFNKLVKPSVNLQLHPYVKSLVNIDEVNLNNSKKFPEVFNEFLEFLDDNSIFVVWGKDDIKVLLNNANFHNLQCELLPKMYIDIQNYGNKYFKVRKGLKIGLKKAVELLKINSTDNFHDAFYDAFCTAEVFKKLYSPSVKPTIYNPTENRKLSTDKKIVDISLLIKQIEKMFKRSMTDEEKEIIRLSYMMGKTNQFIKSLSVKEKEELNL